MGKVFILLVKKVWILKNKFVYLTIRKTNKIMKQTPLEQLRNEDLEHYDTLSFKNYKNSIPRAINFYYDYQEMNLLQRIILAFKNK